jgi:hypothetical protein
MFPKWVKIPKPQKPKREAKQPVVKEVKHYKKKPKDKKPEAVKKIDHRRNVIWPGALRGWGPITSKLDRDEEIWHVN